MAGSDKIRAIEVLAKMHRWNAQEKINVSGELKRGVTLNVTYTMESQPRKKIRLSYHSRWQFEDFHDARRKDVKAMVAELQKPVKEKLAKTIEANFEWATKQLLEVGNLPIGISNARASDKIRAIEVLAKMHGWYAPEKTNLSGEIKRGVTLNATYTVEPRPQEENPT